MRFRQEPQVAGNGLESSQAPRGYGMKAIPALLSLGLLGACSPGEPQRWAPTASLQDQCENAPANATRVTLRAQDGVRLGAAVIGSPDSRVGVIVVHGFDQSLCDWLGEARRIASSLKVRVLVFDRRGVASSEGEPEARKYVDDTVEAARWMKQTGAQEIAVMGSSYGAPIALAAGQGNGGYPDGDGTQAPGSEPSACAVIAVSPATSIEEPSGTVLPLSVKSYGPKLWIVAEEGRPDIAANAAELFHRLGREHRRHLIRIPGEDHSIALVENHEAARAAIDAAIDSCEP